MGIFNRNPGGGFVLISRQKSPSLLSSDAHVLGNMMCEGALNIDGQVTGNITCHTAIIHPNGKVNGEVTAEVVHVYGSVSGLIQARQVFLHPSSRTEGVVLHETLIVAEGAFIDGRCKRTDRVSIPGSALEDSSMSDKSVPTELKLVR